MGGDKFFDEPTGGTEIGRVVDVRADTGVDEEGAFGVLDDGDPDGEPFGEFSVEDGIGEGEFIVEAGLTKPGFVDALAGGDQVQADLAS